MKIEDFKDGMLLKTRDGGEYFYIKGMMFYWCNKNIYDYHCVNEFYDDNLNCSCNRGLDIMRIYHMHELLWERKTDWTKVPFGAKVIASLGDSDQKQVGRFLHYDEKATDLKFLVFIEDLARTKWFKYCELMEEVII